MLALFIHGPLIWSCEISDGRNKSSGTYTGGEIGKHTAWPWRQGLSPTPTTAYLTLLKGIERASTNSIHGRVRHCIPPDLVVFWQNTRNICIPHLIQKYSLCILTFQIRISFAYQLSRSILNLLFYFADLTAFKNQRPLSFSRYHLVLSKLFEGNIIFNNIQTFWTWPVI